MTRRSTFGVVAATTALTIACTLGAAVPATATAPASMETELPAPSPPAEPLACGAVVTTDTTLEDDLVCPDGAGLVLQGDLTFDLAGHALVGGGSTAFDTAALRVDDASQVTVVGGVITGWSQGIVAGPLTDSGRPTIHVRRMTFHDVGSGIVAGRGATVDVDRSRFEGLDVAMFGYNAAMTVTASTFLDNQQGVEGVEGALVRVTRSRLEGSSTAIRCGDAGCELTGSTFRDNTTAVSAYYGTGSVERSLFVGNDRAIHVSWESDLTVETNVFRDNAVGVESGVLDASFVRHNLFSRNGTGIRTETVVEGPGTSTTYERNLLIGNGDGILAAEAGVRLGGNVALRNDGWGINVAGAVDLGGNLARGNGQEPQCVGVACG